MMIFLSVQCAKIAVLYMFGGSHFMTTRVIAEELSKRGHEVTMFHPGSLQKTTKTEFANLYSLKVPEDTLGEIITEVMDAETHGKYFPYNAWAGFYGYHMEICKSVTQDKYAAEYIKNSDMIVGEIQLVCSTLVAEYFQKPFIGILPGAIADSVMEPYYVPQPPSYVPQFGTGYTDKMTFWQRLRNAVEPKIFNPFYMKVIEDVSMEYREMFNVGLDKRMTEIMGQAEIVLASCDFAVDYPQPLMPNIFCVGLFMPKPSAPVTKDLETFMQSSGDDGVILVSFGTVVDDLNEERLKTMINAFSQLKQKVLWKVKVPSNIKLPDNIKAVDWIPQNDLLGHPKIKLFISHVGMSSFHEAAYHGVPLVAVPFVGDQTDNARKVAERLLMGRRLDFHMASTKEWVDTIREVLNDPRYEQNAKKVSTRLRSAKGTSTERAADLVDYILVNGGRVPHLRAYAFNLPWYQYHCVDVFLFLLICFAVLIRVLVFFVKLFLKCLCGSKKKEKVQ